MVFPIPTDSQLQFSSITALVHTEGIYFIMKAYFQVESIEGRGHRFSWEETGIMKNNRIVKMLQWCMGGMLVLLIGVGGILSPLGTHTVHASSVQIRDDASVLDGDQVRSTASQLSLPVSISTVRTFEGPKSDFIRNTEQALTGQDAIALGISVEQRYLAIVAGKQVGLSA